MKNNIIKYSISTTRTRIKNYCWPKNPSFIFSHLGYYEYELDEHIHNDNQYFNKFVGVAVFYYEY